MRTFNPTLLTPGVMTLFLTAFREERKRSYIPGLATFISSNKKSETYAHMGSPPALTEHKGAVEFTPMSDGGYTLKNKLFTGGVGISRRDWRTDNVGGFRMSVESMAEEAVLHPNALLMQALINGDTSAANTYDGVPFFSAAHPARGQAPQQSNIVTGSGTTTAQIASDLNKVLARAISLLKENGRQANVMISEVTICAPGALRQPILEATRAQQINNTSNVSLVGSDTMFKHVFDAMLDADDVDDWYALITGVRVRPLIIQELDPFTLEPEAQNSGAAFDQELLRWKGRWDGNAGYGPWQRGFKVTN